MSRQKFSASANAACMQASKALEATPLVAKKSWLALLCGEFSPAPLSKEAAFWYNTQIKTAQTIATVHPDFFDHDAAKLRPEVLQASQCQARLFSFSSGSVFQQAAAWVQSVWPFSEKRQVAVLSINTMMRCVHAKMNGYGHSNESPLEYQQRILRILEKLKGWLDENPDIEVIAWQEAPITEDDVAFVNSYIREHLPEWDAGNFSATGFGVKTLVKNANQPNAFQLDASFNARMAGYQDRIQTIRLNNRSKLSNVHVPHGKGDTPEEVAAARKAAFKTMIKATLLDMMTTYNPDKELLQHHIVGDKNLPPELIEVYVKETYAELRSEFPGQPFGLMGSYESSANGHRHLFYPPAGGEPIVEMLSVDGCLTLEFIPAGASEEAVSSSRWKGAASMMLLMTMGFNFVRTDCLLEGFSSVGPLVMGI